MTDTLTCSYLNVHAPLWQYPDPYGMETLIGIVLQQRGGSRERERERERDDKWGRETGGRERIEVCQQAGSRGTL